MIAVSERIAAGDAVKVVLGKLAGKTGEVTKVEPRFVTVRIGGASIVLAVSAVELV